VVSIVNRTLASLDLNPLLINLLNEVTDVVTEVVAAVDSLLGSIVQGNSKINFIIDNLGNIVSCSQQNLTCSSECASAFVAISGLQPIKRYAHANRNLFHSAGL
jgi:hypothetical protein